MGPKVETFFNSLAGQPFVWGETDCAMVLLRYLDYMYDFSLYDEFKGTYSTELEAHNFSMHELNMKALIVSIGFTPRAKNFAQIGDVLLSSIHDDVYFSYIDAGTKAFSSHPKHGVRLFDKTMMTDNYEAFRWLPR